MGERGERWRGGDRLRRSLLWLRTPSANGFTQCLSITERMTENRRAVP